MVYMRLQPSFYPLHSSIAILLLHSFTAVTNVAKVQQRFQMGLQDREGVVLISSVKMDPAAASTRWRKSALQLSPGE